MYLCLYIINNSFYKKLPSKFQLIHIDQANCFSNGNRFHQYISTSQQPRRVRNKFRNNKGTQDYKTHILYYSRMTLPNANNFKLKDIAIHLHRKSEMHLTHKCRLDLAFSEKQPSQIMKMSKGHIQTSNEMHQIPNLGGQQKHTIKT